VKQTVPAPRIPDEAGIEPRIRSVDGDTPGEFSITYEWALARPLAEDWRVFVHFTDSEGKILFQNDHDPEPPTSQWMPGTVRQGPSRVKLPEGFAGTVEIRMGLYDSDKVGEGSRGRATLDGPTDGEKRIHVGRLEVTEGKTTFIPLP
jgi:hypothetical protein